MDVESSNLPRNLPRHRHHHHHQCHLARSDHVPLLLAPSVPSVTKYQSKPRPMPSGATPGASQPATDGSLTFSASQAPSGASLVENCALPLAAAACSSESPEGVRTDGWGRLLGSASQRAEAGRPPQSVMEEIRNFFRKRKAIALQKVHHTLSSCSSSHRPWSVALLWILSVSVPCGFFPLGDSVLSVLFHDIVESFRFRAVWILSTRRLIVVVGLVVIVIVVVIAIFSCHVSAHACGQREGLVALLSLRIIQTITRN